MNATGHTGVSAASLWDVLSTPPVLNSGAVGTGAVVLLKCSLCHVSRLLPVCVQARCTPPSCQRRRACMKSGCGTQTTSIETKSSMPQSGWRVRVGLGLCSVPPRAAVGQAQAGSDPESLTVTRSA